MELAAMKLEFRSSYCKKGLNSALGQKVFHY